MTVLSRKSGGSGGGGAPSGPAGGDLEGTYPNPTFAAGSVDNATLGDVGVWAAWVPALTADSGNPTLGSGSSAAGRYTQIGKVVIANGTVAFGTSGTNAGSGVYSISVPVNFGASAGAYAKCGYAFGFDSSTGAVLLAFCYRDNTNHRFNFQGNGNLTQVFGSAAPWAWAASDNIQFIVQYESV